MPWTRREVRFLLSNGSPLSDAKKASMKAELHANPSMGRARKGSMTLKRMAGSGGKT